MVIMENCYPQEQCQHLWLKIDQLHLSYLEMDESPEKILHRSKLEECIAEFLFLVSHRDKFVFHETEDVLYRSAAFKKDFSGYRAATGWNALQIYASNLLTQPWRKEYRHIKTYCGFYKHQIEANLVGAESVFEVMGYKNIGNDILVLEGPICPDRVSNISRDCLVAYVECQILKHIWEEITPNFKISWLDILDYRASYIGNPSQCIKNIKYKYNSKQSVRNVRNDQYDSRPQPTTPTSQVSMTNSHLSVPSSHYAALASHNHVSLPPVVVPPGPYIHPSPYGYGTYPVAPMVRQPLPTTVTNGYFYVNGPSPMRPSTYPVPTGQLIELDSRNGYDVVDETPSRVKKPSRVEVNLPEDGDRVRSSEEVVKNGGPSPDIRQDIEEDWDYVYRNLERQGYSKDLGERGDVLGLTVSDKQRKHKEPKKVKSTNLDEVMQSVTVSDRPLKMNEALEHLEKRNIEKNHFSKERRNSQGSTYENVAQHEVSKQSKVTIPRIPQNITIQPKVTQEKIANVVELPKPVVAEVKKPAKEQGRTASNQWECKSCTYFNSPSKTICEMCGKSRSAGEESPMEVGGPECSKCTLVNPRNAKICQACGSSLANSPTYI